MALKSIDSLPIIDAKKPLILHITEQDVRAASRKEPSFCAAAIACRRELYAQEARIHLGRVYLRTTKGNWTRYITPKSLRSEIIAFDRGGRFEPGEFVLSAPHPASRVTGTMQGTKTSLVRDAKRRKNAKKHRTPTIVQDVRNGPA